MKKAILIMFFLSPFISNLYAGAAPNITSINPDNGPVSGGKVVSIIGRNFFNYSTILFGDTAATVMIVVSDTEIACIPPDHEAGVVDVTISDQTTGQSSTCTACYSFLLPPVVEMVSPDHGPCSGAAVVAISGENFVEGMKAAFGGAEAQIISISDTELILRTPSHEPGLVDLTISNPHGESYTFNSCYTYIHPPEISEMIPCPASANSEISIIGTHFDKDAQVILNGVLTDDVLPDDMSISETQINCKIPSQTRGMINEIRIINFDGQSAHYICPALPPPRILSPITPDHGPVGTTITIRGEKFVDGVTVSFGDINAKIVTVTSTELVVTAPPHVAGAVDVVTTNPDEKSNLVSNAYTYIPFSLTPGYGTTAGGTELLIKGENFTADTAILFDGAPAENITLVSSEEITCTSPEHFAGQVNVVIKHSGQPEIICENCYQYIAESDPLELGTVCEEQNLDCKTSSARLWVSEVMSLHSIEKVWARITLPEGLDDPTYKPSLELEDSDSDGVYEGTFTGFDQLGTYKIGTYAKDETGYYCIPRETSVTRTCDKGDVNRDGILNLDDIISVFNVLANTNALMPEQPDYSFVDVNGDGKMGLEEIVYLLGRLSD